MTVCSCPASRYPTDRVTVEGARSRRVDGYHAEMASRIARSEAVWEADAAGSVRDVSSRDPAGTPGEPGARR